MYTLMSWERKIRRAHAKLFTYLQVRLGAQCDRLSINCSFEGKPVSSMEVNWRNELPYCVSKELSLEILLLHTRGETICSLFSTSEERPLFSCEDRCLLAGQFCAFKLPVINYFLLHDSRVMSSTVPVGMQTPDQDRRSPLPCCSLSESTVHWQTEADAYSEGRSEQHHMAVSCCLPRSLLWRFHVHCSWVWIGVKGGSSPAVTHSTQEIVADTAVKFPYSSSCLAAEAKLNHWADLILLCLAQLWFNLT